LQPKLVFWFLERKDHWNFCLNLFWFLCSSSSSQ
jgi:hypothetical protein